VLEAKVPFYFMAWVAAATALDQAIPGWSIVDARHLVNFLVFQGAVVAVYLLSRRVARHSVALVVALCFETQPLLFGHAFINQKDSTFMAFFAVAVVVGLSGVDRFVREKGKGRSMGVELLRPPADSKARADVPRIQHPVPRATAVLALACLLPILRILLDTPLRSWTENTVQALSSGTAWPPLSRLFLRIAENVATAPPSAYVNKAFGILDMAVGAACLGLCAAAFWLARATWRPPADSPGISGSPLCAAARMAVAMRRRFPAAVLVAACAGAGRAAGGVPPCYGISRLVTSSVANWGCPSHAVECCPVYTDHESLLPVFRRTDSGLYSDLLDPLASCRDVGLVGADWKLDRNPTGSFEQHGFARWFLIPCRRRLFGVPL
jgi:hypothetical protein